MGLTGAYIIDDDIKDSMNLPTGKYSMPLVLSDRSFEFVNDSTTNFQRMAKITVPTKVNDRGGLSFDRCLCVSNSDRDSRI